MKKKSKQFTSRSVDSLAVHVATCTWKEERGIPN